MSENYEDLFVLFLENCFKEERDEDTILIV